jgi:hypothetical protein
MPNDGNWWSRTDDTTREDETFSPFVRGQGLGSARADFGSGVSDPFVPLPWSREMEPEMEESAFETESEVRTKRARSSGSARTARRSSRTTRQRWSATATPKWTWS